MRPICLLPLTIEQIFAAIVVFRLGWFFPIVAVVDAAVAAVAAARWGASQGSRVGTIAWAVGSYALVFSLLVWSLVGRESVRSLEATWQDRGVDSTLQEADVFLEFVGHPGHGIGVYSTALRDRLAADGATSVRVDVAITTDAGCLRGFRQIQIGSTADPAIINGKGGYARGGHPAQSPWASHFWWCQ